ncbi:MAG TPA: PUA domain-containing protein, partial [Anaerolineaceae bacterium]
ERGDTVRISAADGKPLAVGLAGYASDDLARLCGCQSKQIETILGYTFGDEVIHRNNMILL